MQTTALLKKEASKGAVHAFGKFTNPLQRKAVDEEEDALQMKQAPVQRMDGLDDEEEEPLQMKQNPLQRMEDKDDELLQKKDNPLQLKQEGQNPLQLKQTVGSPLQLQAEEIVAPQPKKNNTGLPDNLKAGVEALSGYSMDDVKVHYNSDKPAQLQALAYAQGTDIHVAPRQEKHLPHEAWHVVQQKQGRVQPTLQMKEGIAVNDDKGLEREADAMGIGAVTYEILVDTSSKYVNNKLAQTPNIEKQGFNPTKAQSDTLQRQVVDDYGKELSKEAVEIILNRLILKKGKNKVIQKKMEWFDELKYQNFQVNINDFINAKSLDDIIKKIKKEGSFIEEELGNGAHAMQEHATNTKEEMLASIKKTKSTTEKTRFVDISRYEEMLQEVKQGSSQLKMLLEDIGVSIAVIYPPQTSINYPSNDNITEVVTGYFSGGKKGGMFTWSLNGEPSITQQAGGQRTIQINWKAESINKFKKIRISEEGQEDYVVAPLTVWGGLENLVQLIVNLNNGTYRTEQLDGNLKYKTVY